MPGAGMFSRRGTTSSWRRRARARTQRGAAAVEAVFVIAAILAPLLLGILNYGQRFWDEQQVSLYPQRLDASVASGFCTTQQIVDRVKAAAANSIYSLNATTLNGLGITSAGDLANYLVVTVQSAGSVGADVNVSVNLPSRQVGNIIPLPGGSKLLVRDLNQRLNYVSVSTSGTQCSP